VDLLKACGVTVRESSLRRMNIGKASGLRQKGQRRHFCKRRFNWQRRSTISNGVTREARRHCYGRHYSDLSPNPLLFGGIAVSSFREMAARARNKRRTAWARGSADPTVRIGARCGLGKQASLKMGGDRNR
jgi:hypothetical protein